MLKAARVLVLVGGLGIVGLGLLGAALASLVDSIIPAGSPLAFATFTFSAAAIAVLLGAALAWQASQSLRHRPSGRFSGKRTGWLVALFVATLVGGSLVVAHPEWPDLALAPFHLLATALPPLVLLGLVARGLAGAFARRETILQLSSGALIGTTLASILELGLIVAVIAGVAVALALQPGGLVGIEALGTQLEDPNAWAVPGGAGPLTLSPLVVVAVLAGAGVAVPLIEEAVKTVGVGLMAYRRPTRAQAFFWGVAGGAGFALIEGMLNSMMGLSNWAPAVLLRLGGTLLHCFTGGLVGLAWYATLADRRWLRTVGLYATAVTIHGLWNALVVGITFISLSMTGDTTLASVPVGRVAALSVLALVGGLALLALGMCVGLAILTGRVRDGDAAGAAPEAVAPGLQLD
jgi:hypothetical protein